MPFLSCFVREFSVSSILRDRVFSGCFAGSDPRVSFDGCPAFRGQPFVAAWLCCFPLSSASASPGYICLQGDNSDWWANLLAAEFEEPLGPAPCHSITVSFLPSIHDNAAAVVLFSLSQSRRTPARSRRQRRRWQRDHTSPENHSFAVPDSPASDNSQVCSDPQSDSDTLATLSSSSSLGQPEPVEADADAIESNADDHDDPGYGLLEGHRVILHSDLGASGRDETNLLDVYHWVHNGLHFVVRSEDTDLAAVLALAPLSRDPARLGEQDLCAAGIYEDFARGIATEVPAWAMRPLSWATTSADPSRVES